MARVIDSEVCLGCGACVDACPSEAISEQDDKYVIDADGCNDCGACEDECPEEAISAD